MMKLAIAAALMTTTGLAMGQGLYQLPAQVPLNERGEPDTTIPLRGVSMMIVEPTPPPTYHVHDLITIVVNESSSLDREQTIETQREYQNTQTLNAFPDLSALLREQSLRDGVGTAVTPLDIDSSSEYTGEATYERKDRVTNRITAEIIDVKPNGVLVLEARTRIQSDEEIQEFRLSGSCRTEDVSSNNTVQSNQLYGLQIETHHEGELRTSTRKGWLTRFIDTVSPF